VLLRIQQLCSRSSKSLLATDAIKSVVALVLATKHMSEKAETSQDIAALTAVMLDIDLSVLGRVREEYEGYEKDIRSEYIHVPLEGYCAGRTKILEMFLGQARARQLFHSECFSCMVQPNGLSWHENAEINMTWAIEELASQMREAEMQESPSEYPIGETLASAQEELGEEESENLTALRDMLTSHP
jgi:predicted metal-dependent HD superfamily phosphohydrolase